MRFKNAVFLLAAVLGQALTPVRAEDARALVQMPDVAITLLREEMQRHLLTLSEVLSLQAGGKSAQAAATVRAQLGSGAMGLHRGKPEAPGRHMSAEMRMMGLALHRAADAWAERIERGAPQAEVTAAQQEVMASCAACHMAYRVR